MKRRNFIKVTASPVVVASASSVMGIFAVQRVEAVVGEATPAGIRPYLQTAQPDSIRVSWWSDSATTAMIEWGTEPSSLTNTVSAVTDNLGAGYRYHTGVITGLQPGTFYYYRVHNAEAPSAVFRFKTPPPVGTKAGKLRALIIGDNQISSEPRWEILVSRIKPKIEQMFGKPIEEVIDIVLNVGDQVDVGTNWHYRNVHFAFSRLISPNLPFATAVGNHETYSDSSLAMYRRMFFYDGLTYQGIASPNPTIYYAFQQANILFIYLSSEHTGTTQANWVQQLVNAAKIDNSVDFIISVVHRPYQAEQFIGDISSWFRTTVMPILCQTEKHVLNVGGHHHIYHRGQTRQWPCYHIINGATSWDQYWGQSTEQDYDDVQKTLALWAWQIAEFDLAEKTMQVDCWAEGNVRFSGNARWAYNSRHVDSFHRKLGLAAPAKPSFVNPPTGTITLPANLQSAAFASTAGEALNSSWFQIAKDNSFTNPRVDLIRDIENFYGDTGAPNYEPVDRHAGLNILQYPLPSSSLPNGIYFARVRHRDQNAMWSAWSDPISFEVTGGINGDPAMTTSKSVFAVSEAIPVDFEFGPRNTRDWIGIYQIGQTPGPTASTDWKYLNGTRTAPAQGIASGRLSFTPTLVAGREYFLAFFANDGYAEITPRIPFYVGGKPTLTASKSAYAEGETVRVDYSGATPVSTNWIGIYRVGRRPGLDGASVQWGYTPNASGSRNFTNLAKGYYFAAFMVNGQYFEVAERVYFSIGNDISTVATPKTTLAYREDFQVSFSEGPGTPKDYVGIFRKGEEPGEGDLVSYLYVGGLASGTVRFTQDIEPGDYWLALLINDTYSTVSNRIDFTVSPRPEFVLEPLEAANGELRMAFSSEQTVNYRLWKSPDMTEGSWVIDRTIPGTGGRIEMNIPMDENLDRCFYKLERID